MKTKCLMWVETKLKNLEGPVTQPVSLGNLSYCNCIETWGRYVREEAAQIL